MKRVVLCLKQKVKQGHENDFGVLNGYKTTCTIKGGGYASLLKKAEDFSKKIGDGFIGNYFFGSSDVVDYGLAAVCLETVMLKEEGSGVICDYFVNGVHSDTKVESADFYLIEENKKKEFGTMGRILKNVQALQKRNLVHSFSIDYRNDSVGDDYVCVTIFKNNDSTPQSFAFYNFRTINDNIKEYECLVNLIDGRAEEREELNTF